MIEIKIVTKIYKEIEPKIYDEQYSKREGIV